LASPHSWRRDRDEARSFIAERMPLRNRFVHPGARASRDQASFVEILELDRAREDLRGTRPLKQNFSRLELIPFLAV
jgi:hypothetical protein